MFPTKYVCQQLQLHLTLSLAEFEVDTLCASVTKAVRELAIARDGDGCNNSFESFQLFYSKTSKCAVNNQFLGAKMYVASGIDISLSFLNHFLPKNMQCTRTSFPFHNIIFLFIYHFYILYTYTNPTWSFF